MLCVMPLLEQQLERAVALSALPSLSAFPNFRPKIDRNPPEPSGRLSESGMAIQSPIPMLIQFLTAL